MSENSSEYLKRTCLICGCHTNQTINIYEPRSGPNIVQLIQAKFKFQPLNEDKYLCFSCNNWLINWHSLQALNSNDAESPSGTFRSHLNSGNVMQDEKSSGSKKQIAVCRPIAQVRPRQLEESEKLEPQPLATEQLLDETSMDDTPHEQSEESDSNKFDSKINFNKRNFRLQLIRRGGSRLQHKSMQQCLCGRSIVVRCTKNSKKTTTTSQTSLKCRKCRELSHLKASYMRSILQVEKELSVREAPLVVEHSNPQNLVIATDLTETHLEESQIPQQQQLQQQPPQQCHFLPKPSVDGKVVSMLRRLGTTLSREPQENGSQSNVTNTLPQIMSPSKPKSKWLRPLKDDEILVNFDSSISEVLPSLAAADQFTHVNTIAARKRLTFQVSETAEVIDLCEEEDEDDQVVIDEENEFMDIEDTDLKSSFNLPKGLIITLI